MGRTLPSASLRAEARPRFSCNEKTLGTTAAMKDARQKLWQGASYLLCVVATWRDPYGLSRSEFSGGRTTSWLLNLCDAGCLVFVAALLLTFAYRRIAAAVAIIASCSCLPLYLYFVAPGPFRRIFWGEYSVPLRANFLWDSWAIESLLALTLATCVSLFVLRT